MCTQAFCDERGAALTREQAGERLARELKLDRSMRMYHRHSDTQTCAAYLPASTAAHSSIYIPVMDFFATSGYVHWAIVAIMRSILSPYCAGHLVMLSCVLSAGGAWLGSPQGTRALGVTLIWSRIIPFLRTARACASRASTWTCAPFWTAGPSPCGEARPFPMTAFV